VHKKTLFEDTIYIEYNILTGCEICLSHENFIGWAADLELSDLRNNPLKVTSENTIGEVAGHHFTGEGDGDCNIDEQTVKCTNYKRV